MTKFKNNLVVKFEVSINLFIVTASVVSVTLLAIVLDSLYNVRIELTSKNTLLRSDNKVKAATTHVLYADIQSCSVVVFSWLPPANRKVSLKVFKFDETANNKPIALTKNYQEGHGVAVWSRAEPDTRYLAALYSGGEIISNQILLSTPSC